jgi:hypothetical protein
MKTLIQTFYIGTIGVDECEVIQSQKEICKVVNMLNLSTVITKRNRDIKLTSDLDKNFDVDFVKIENDYDIVEALEEDIELWDSCLYNLKKFNLNKHRLNFPQFQFCHLTAEQYYAQIKRLIQAFKEHKIHEIYYESDIIDGTINADYVAEDVTLHVYNKLRPNVNPFVTDEENNTESYTEEVQDVYNTVYDILQIHLEECQNIE